MSWFKSKWEYKREIVPFVNSGKKFYLAREISHCDGDYLRFRPLEIFETLKDAEIYMEDIAR